MCEMADKNRRANFVTASVQAFQHCNRFARIVWLSKNVIVNCHEGVRGENDLVRMCTCRG